MPTASSFVGNEFALEFSAEERFLQRILCDRRIAGETGEKVELAMTGFAGGVTTMDDGAERMRLGRDICIAAELAGEVAIGCEGELKCE